jgi:phage shock protein PspC (stress-responsive transcriptional regulator)
MIGGICGGVAEYFEIDPTMVRIGMVVLALIGGWGIVAYIIGLIIIPEHPMEYDEEGVAIRKAEKNGTATWGVMCILAGLILLLHNYGWFPWVLWKGWTAWRVLWPVLIIIVGVLLLLSRSGLKEHRHSGGVPVPDAPVRRLTRSRKSKMIGGVCGGLAEYYRLDPTLIRLLWAFGTILFHGMGILVYIIFFFVLPEEAGLQEHHGTSENRS